MLEPSFFTLEDVGLAKAAAGRLSNFAILSAAQPELGILYASSRCCNLCGCSKEAAVGTRLVQALQLPPDSVDVLGAALEQCAPVCMWLEAAQRVRVAFWPVSDAVSGLLLYWIACFDPPAPESTDEAAEPDCDAAAAAAEDLVQQADAVFAPAVFTLGSAQGHPDASPSVEMVNERFVELTGYTAADLGTVGWHGLFGPAAAADILPKIDAAISSNQPGAWSTLLYGKGGICRWCYIYTCPVPSGHLCLALDVTCASLKRIGAYIVGKVIGHGTYGTVRIGKDLATGELVALKLVDTHNLKHLDELQQLQDEMSVLAALRHPRIIRLWGTQQVQDRMICIIMEYAHGGSLKEYMDLQENRVLSEGRAKHFFEQMVNAVDYCHRRRVVHRDIKPENILLDESGDIKIADFGLAGITSPFDGNLSETCGTVEFTAPEVLTRQEYNGSAADMWSLGAVVYEMLAGKSPFKGPNAAAIVKAACKGVYPPLPDYISPTCKDLLSRLLTVQPAQRMTMEEVVCHPWLLGDMAPVVEEAAAATSAISLTSSGEQQSGGHCCGEQSGSEAVCSGPSTRHNSLRLVVPGMEELPVVPEGSEGNSPAGSAALGKAISPRRSFTASTAAASSKTAHGSPTREPLRRSRSSATSRDKAASPSTKIGRSSSGVPDSGLHAVQITFSGQDALPSRNRSRSQRGAC